MPIIWSVIYRIPVAIFQSAYSPTGERINVKEVVRNFAANGGCAMIVVFLALQVVFFVCMVFVASSTLAEAQRFSTEKGVANLAIALVGPVLILIAAAFAFTFNH